MEGEDPDVIFVDFNELLSNIEPNSNFNLQQQALLQNAKAGYSNKQLFRGQTSKVTQPLQQQSSMMYTMVPPNQQQPCHQGGNTTVPQFLYGQQQPSLPFYPPNQKFYPMAPIAFPQDQGQNVPTIAGQTPFIPGVPATPYGLTVLQPYGVGYPRPMFSDQTQQPVAEQVVPDINASSKSTQNQSQASERPFHPPQQMTAEYLQSIAEESIPSIHPPHHDDDENRGDEKPMTREQFYKIRPKVPKITKGDARRGYAAAFAAAYNASSSEAILDFLVQYCTDDVLFVHRWVGEDLYVNFPRYLEVRGTDSVTEYWFSRCVLSPDIVLEMKDTKLYVRSDGISTVLSSFTINCTRMYDSEVSDALICIPATDEDLRDSAERTSTTDSASTSKDDLGAPKKKKKLSKVEAEQIHSLVEEKAEKIRNRVYEKVKQILLHYAPGSKTNEDANDSSKKAIDLFRGTDMASHPITKDTTEERKVLPKDSTTTLLGTVVLHVDVNHKIHQIDLTFALQE